MTTREKFGSFVAAIRCPNKECHDKGFTMYPEDMEDNILPCLCHGCGKMFYVEIDQEENLEEEPEKERIEDLSEEVSEILDKEEKTAKKRRVSKEKDTQRPERRIDRQKAEEESSRKHTSFLTNFEDDDDEIYDEEDDFDFAQYQKRLKKRQSKKKKETEHRRRERSENLEDLVEEKKIEKQADLEIASTRQDDNDYEEDWEKFSFVKKQKNDMSPKRKTQQRSLDLEKVEEEIEEEPFSDFSSESDLLKRTEKEEKRKSKKKAEKKSVFDEDSELDREFEAMLDDDSDEWFFGDEKKSDFGKLRNIFQRKNHK